MRSAIFPNNTQPMLSLNNASGGPKNIYVFLDLYCKACSFQCSRAVAIVEACGDAAPPIFSLSAHLPNISSARLRCIADKAQGKSVKAWPNDPGLYPIFYPIFIQHVLDCKCWVVCPPYWMIQQMLDEV